MGGLSELKEGALDFEVKMVAQSPQVSRPPRKSDVGSFDRKNSKVMSSFSESSENSEFEGEIVDPANPNRKNMWLGIKIKR